MPDCLTDFQERRNLLRAISFNDDKLRLSAFAEWLESEVGTKRIIDELRREVDGANAEMLIVTASPAATVVPNGGTTFIIRFTPSSRGVKSAMLRIASNDANENPFEIWLTGATPLPEITVEQPSNTNLLDGASMDFGNVDVGSSNSLTVTIKNTGTEDLNGLGITVDGTNAAMFAVIASPTVSVVPDGNTTFTIHFTPTSPGAKTATLQITNDDADENPFNISLTGAGLMPVTEAWVRRYNGWGTATTKPLPWRWTAVATLW